MQNLASMLIRLLKTITNKQTRQDIKNCRPYMGIKLIHESLEPLTEPDIFEAMLDLVARARGATITGMAIVYVVDENDETTVENLQIIGKGCDPEHLMDGLIDVAMDIVHEYDLKEFMPGGE